MRGGREGRGGGTWGKHSPGPDQDVRARGWRPGDRIQPLGMTGQKKLQDLFTDLRVPRSWRDSVPLLETENGIAWVVGHRIAEWVKVHPDFDEPVVWIQFSQNQG